MQQSFRRTWAIVDIDAINNNISAIRSVIKPACKIMSVVKADAYGHGAENISKQLEEKTDYFGVSSIDEALQLRRIGIVKPILILGYTPLECIRLLIENDVIQTVFSSEYAKNIAEIAKNYQKKIKIHLKIDTGMSRLGFSCQTENEQNNSVNDILNIYREFNKYLDFEGIYTHFAIADEQKNNYTKTQFERFISLLNDLKNKNLEFSVRHTCNSAATINFPEMHLDMVRPGLLLYGLYPSQNMKNIGIIPAMQLKSVISQIRTIQQNATVSYGRVYKTSEETVVATLPIGYADGFPRLLSNNAEVLVNGCKCPVIGRICMDQMMINITNIFHATEGQEVTIVGSDGNECINFEELAKNLETINYELICIIGKRVPRIYMQNGKIIGYFNYIEK